MKEKTLHSPVDRVMPDVKRTKTFTVWQQAALAVAKRVATACFTTSKKTLTWRVLASSDTFGAAAVFTGDPVHAAAIVAGEFATKMPLYFMFEKACYLVPFGKNPDGTDTNLRSKIKTGAYRLVASADTGLQALWTYAALHEGSLSMAPTSTEAWKTAGAMVAWDITSKLFLYWRHERWHAGEDFWPPYHTWAQHGLSATARDALHREKQGEKKYWVTHGLSQTVVRALHESRKSVSAAPQP